MAERDKTIVEAALFAATGSLTVADIAERTKLSESGVRYALKDLRMEYDMRDSAMVISATGGDYRMLLRPEYQKYTDLFARPEMPPGVMRTLAAIAYNQPVLQSKLVDTRGPRAYEDVGRLVERGYVYSRPSGQSYELTTTKKFAEDFGIGSTRKEDIRKWIDRMSTGNYVPPSRQQSSDAVPGDAAPEAPAAEDGAERPEVPPQNPEDREQRPLSGPLRRSAGRRGHRGPAAVRNSGPGTFGGPCLRRKTGTKTERLINPFSMGAGGNGACIRKKPLFSGCLRNSRTCPLRTRNTAQAVFMDEVRDAAVVRYGRGVDALRLYSVHRRLSAGKQHRQPLCQRK